MFASIDCVKFISNSKSIEQKSFIHVLPWCVCGAMRWSFGEKSAFDWIFVDLTNDKGSGRCKLM